MLTKVNTLSAQKSDWKILHDEAIATFLHDESFAFARALHDGLGWPIAALMQGDTIRHALVREPSGEFRDVCGIVTPDECCRTFGLPLPAVTRFVRVNDLVRGDANGVLSSVMVKEARKMAETLWPQLPWRNSPARKAQAFTDEFESMCRRHGLWLRFNTPVVIAPECEDESGYVLQPISDGNTFCIKRSFN